MQSIHLHLFHFSPFEINMGFISQL